MPNGSSSSTDRSLGGSHGSSGSEAVVDRPGARRPADRGTAPVPQADRGRECHACQRRPARRRRSTPACRPGRPLAIPVPESYRTHTANVAGSIDVLEIADFGPGAADIHGHVDHGRRARWCSSCSSDHFVIASPTGASIVAYMPYPAGARYPRAGQQVTFVGTLMPVPGDFAAMVGSEARVDRLPDRRLRHGRAGDPRVDPVTVVPETSLTPRGVNGLAVGKHRLSRRWSNDDDLWHFHRERRGRGSARRADAPRSGRPDRGRVHGVDRHRSTARSSTSRRSGRRTSKPRRRSSPPWGSR